MQLYFIRHGQSENNARWNGSDYIGARSPDPELTDVGRQQAELVARFLQGGAATAPDGSDPHNLTGFGLTHLYCSLMVRAVSTGMHIARALELPLVAWPDLHEVGGIVQEDKETGKRTGLPGNNRAFFEQHYPDLVLPESLGDAGWWNRPFEEQEQRLPRARRFLAALRERHGQTDDRVAVVSHGGFYKYLLLAILNLPTQNDFWFSMNNCALSRFDFVEEGMVGLVYSNRVDYLPPELIT